jgi:hypothetical protein
LRFEFKFDFHFIVCDPVVLRNIHIRYEDTSTRPFACGITIEELRSESTNSAGNSSFCKPVDEMFKVFSNQLAHSAVCRFSSVFNILQTVNLTNMSIYWNSLTTLLRCVKSASNSVLVFLHI